MTQQIFGEVHSGHCKPANSDLFRPKDCKQRVPPDCFSRKFVEMIAKLFLNTDVAIWSHVAAIFSNWLKAATSETETFYNILHDKLLPSKYLEHITCVEPYLVAESSKNIPSFKQADITIVSKMDACRHCCAFLTRFLDSNEVLNLRFISYIPYNQKTGKQSDFPSSRLKNVWTVFTLQPSFVTVR
jgi:hypothetical protein